MASMVNHGESFKSYPRNLWFHGGQGHVLDVEFFPPSASRVVLASLHVTHCEMHGEAVTCSRLA